MPCFRTRVRYLIRIWKQVADFVPVDVVIQNTASWSSAIAGNLINALGERRKTAGGEKYYIQVSVCSLASPVTY